jgi:hypothetical protein
VLVILACLHCGVVQWIGHLLRREIARAEAVYRVEISQLFPAPSCGAPRQWVTVRVIERFKGPEIAELQLTLLPTCDLAGFASEQGRLRLDPTRFSVGRSYLVALGKSPKFLPCLGPWSAESISAQWHDWEEWLRPFAYAAR